MNYNIIDNLIVLNLFKPCISFIMDLDPIFGFHFIPPFVINQKEKQIRALNQFENEFENKSVFSSEIYFITNSLKSIPPQEILEQSLYKDDNIYLDKKCVLNLKTRSLLLLKLKLDEFKDKGDKKETIRFYLRRKGGKKYIN